MKLTGAGVNYFGPPKSWVRERAVMEKRCSKCRNIKPVTEFYRCEDGYASQCKICQGETCKAWRAANPRRVRIADRARRVREVSAQYEIDLPARVIEQRFQSALMAIKANQQFRLDDEIHVSKSPESYPLALGPGKWA